MTVEITIEHHNYDELFEQHKKNGADVELTLNPYCNGVMVFYKNVTNVRCNRGFIEIELKNGFWFSIICDVHTIVNIYGGNQ